MKLVPYMDALDLSELPEQARLHLGRFVVPAMINKLYEDGIEITVAHDLNILPRVQSLHPRKPRLFEIGDPKFQPSASAADTFVLLLQRNGEDVGCVACRLKWIETNLADALRRRTLIFESPAIAGDSQFAVTTPLAYRIESVPVAVITGLCVMPAEDRVVMKILVRLTQLMSAAHWRWTWSVALCTPKFAARYPIDVEGYSSIHGGVRWKRDGEWCEYRLVTAERAHMRLVIGSPEFADLSGSLGAPTSGGAP